MVGFDMARTFVPVEASGRANGFVNIGGFTASLLTMALIEREARRPVRRVEEPLGERERQARRAGEGDGLAEVTAEREDDRAGDHEEDRQDEEVVFHGASAPHATTASNASVAPTAPATRAVIARVPGFARARTSAASASAPGIARRSGRPALRA